MLLPGPGDGVELYVEDVDVDEAETLPPALVSDKGEALFCKLSRSSFFKISLLSRGLEESFW